MVRTSPASSALLIAAACALPVSHAHMEYKVRVRNLTHQQPFSPPAMVVHTSDVFAFKEGLPAPPGLKVLAETGDLSTLGEEINLEDVQHALCGYVVSEEAVNPGGEGRYTLTVDETICGKNPKFTFAAMLVNTNDAFVGVDSLSLSYTNSAKIYPPAFDAGTEENNELCSHIPGPACSATSGNAEEGPGEGYVHVHRGFHGVAGELSAAGYDWRNPVAEIYISKPTVV